MLTTSVIPIVAILWSPLSSASLDCFVWILANSTICTTIQTEEKQNSPQYTPSLFSHTFFAMPFETETETASFGGNNVQLCAYRPALESKLSSLNTSIQQQVAVEVSGVCLSYGRGKSLKSVLNSISLNVPEAAM